MPKPKLFHARALVTSNEKHEVFDDAFLAIEEDKILDCGPWKKHPQSKSFSIEELPHGMIAPGLFNLHTHLPMSLLKGIVEDVNLHSWLFDTIFPTEEKWVSPHFVRVGAELALCECIRSGVTYVGDMYYYCDEIASAVDQAGLRGMIAKSIFDHGGMDTKSLDESLEVAIRLHKKFLTHPRIQIALAPHAPYTCSPDTLRRASMIAKELNLPMMIHLAETKKEADDIQKKWGQSPTEYLEKSGLLNSKNVLLAHSIWLEDSDYKLLSKPNITCVLNPQSNAKLGSGLPPVNKMIDRGVRFAMGTDGSASNNNLDIFSELNFFSKAHHLVVGDLKSLPGPRLFDAATRKAAEAVGLGKELGSLEAGKQADFIVIDLKTPHLTPLTHPYSHLIYSVQGPDVQDLYVAGKCLMKNRKIRSLDEENILKKAEHLWKQIARGLSEN